MRRFQILLAIALFSFLPAAQGQVGLYANFSASQLDSPSTSWFYGPTFGAYYDGVHLPVVNFGADLRASFLGSNGNGGNPQVYSGMIGPRAVLHSPLLPIRPYGEILAGAGHVQNITTDQTFFGYGVLGGADLNVLPRLDWRVVEFGYTWFATGPHQKTLSTGLVFRVPVP